MKKLQIKHLLFIYCICVCIAVVTVIFCVANKSNLHQMGDDYQRFMEGWYEEDGSKAEFVGISGEYVICHEIPQIEQARVIYFNVKSVNVAAYIGEKCVYETPMQNIRLFGKSPGAYFVRIPISLEDEGKVIKLCITNPYEDESGKITEICFGNEYDILASHIDARMWGFCISLIITFLGILFLVLFVPMWKNRVVGRELLYLGLFAFCMGMFMVTDCKYLQTLYPNPHFYHMISETCMKLLVVPLFLFLGKIYEECSSKIVAVVCTLGIFDFVLSYILNILAIKDYHETIWITHVTYVIAVICLIFVIAKGLAKEPMKKVWHNIGIFAICVAAILDIVMLKVGTSLETTFFTRMGVLLFMCLEGVQIVWKFLISYQEGMKSKFLQKLAYQDGLTELLNRTSFMEELERLEKERPKELLIALFDVNNLKYANDTFGHSCGDEMLKIVATTMWKCFNKYGNCYRIGGDEFVFVGLEQDCDEKFADILEKLNEMLECAVEEKEFPFSISVATGYAVLNPNRHQTITEVVDEADEKMYENKKKMKSTDKK